MQGKDVKLDNVVMRFDDFTAVHPTSLQIEAGSFFSILGPSGCGKTTILRMISGFLPPTEGDILIGDQSMSGIGPNKRPTAMIFQNLALFPLMSVWENVAYGLAVSGMSKIERRKKANELLDLVALTDYATRMPDELSGGQRQRVAIARALAVEPAILLLDEPLSALDLKLRQHMRSELKAIQRETGVTFIYITHDQGEALTMSDKVAVMNNGRIEQVGEPATLYNHPKTAFVASFVGENNLLKGPVKERQNEYALIDTELGLFKGRVMEELKVGDEAFMFIRPEQNLIKDAAAQCENRFKAVIKHKDMEGSFYNLHLKADKGIQYQVHLTNTGNVDHQGEIEVGFKADNAFILKPGSIADE